MRRKRIAIFANGWSSENIMRIGNGAWKVAQDRDVDLFTFVDYTALENSAEYNEREFSIFKLPDLKDFDGVILATNSFNLPIETENLSRRVYECGIPAISLEVHLKGMDYIGVNNQIGMEELAEHLFRDHNVKNPLLIAGIKGHEESEERIDITIRVAKQYGVMIDREEVQYGNWSAEGSTEVMEKWLNDHDRLPDAIICMNDVMALGVLNYMRQQGYRIPEDVLLTGFDGLYRGQQQEPVLTSVNHEWETMGKRALELLLDRIARQIDETTGKEAENIEQREVNNEIVQTSMLYGESCGCCVNNKRFLRKPAIDGFATDQHFRHLYLTAKKSITAEAFNKNISEYFSKENWLEGDNFMLCLNPGFFDFLDENNESMVNREFDSNLDVVCALHNGIPRKRMKLTRQKSMFRVAEESDKPGNYIFASISSDNHLYGYGMMTRDFEVVNNNVLYIWIRHLGMYMEQVRSNIGVEYLTKKLERLSVTDGLTQVYNRIGMDQIMIPFMNRVQEEGGSSIFLMVDIDRMKIINDSQGHMKGDLAIQTVAQVLKEALPKDYYISRYGGDEFVCVGEIRNEVSIEAIVEQIQTELLHRMSEKEIDFRLGVSVGGTILEKGRSFDFKKCLDEADSKMYLMKEKHHQEQDN